MFKEKLEAALRRLQEEYDKPGDDCFKEKFVEEHNRVVDELSKKHVKEDEARAKKFIEARERHEREIDEMKGVEGHLARLKRYVENHKDVF